MLAGMARRPCREQYTMRLGRLQKHGFGQYTLAAHKTQCSSTNTTAHQRRYMGCPSVHIVPVCLSVCRSHGATYTHTTLPQPAGNIAPLQPHVNTGETRAPIHATCFKQCQARTAVYCRGHWLPGRLAAQWRPHTHNAASANDTTAHRRVEENI